MSFDSFVEVGRGRGGAGMGGGVENCFWRREGLDGKGLVNFWRGMIRGF